MKEHKGVKLDTELDASDLKKLVVKYKDYYKKVFGEDFPNDPYVQLIEAITAVFRSWDNPRANVYRKMNGIPYSWVPPSTSNRWLLATKAKPAAPASPSRVRRPPVKSSFLPNIFPTPRAKTSSRHSDAA
jgi:hypothetical protein